MPETEIQIYDPILRTTAYVELGPFLEMLDPMNPAEYATYYEEVLKPMQKAGKELIGVLGELEEFSKKYS
jgi:hypothetical protein